jgi:hypothetical protein
MPITAVASTNNGYTDVSIPITAVSNGRLTSAYPLLLCDHNSNEIVVVGHLSVAIVS